MVVENDPTRWNGTVVARQGFPFFNGGTEIREWEFGQNYVEVTIHIDWKNAMNINTVYPVKN